jgi:hypothetical protein
MSDTKELASNVIRRVASLWQIDQDRSTLFDNGFDWWPGHFCVRFRVAVSTPEQDCIAFRSKDASIMPTRMPSSTGLSRGRQVGVRSSLGVSALLRRERRLL